MFSLETLNKRKDLIDVRKAAWERFSQLGMPKKKQDAFHYFPLRAFSEEVFSEASLPAELPSVEPYPECTESCIVFINGIFSPALSLLAALPKQVVILPLKEAFRSYSAFLQNKTAKIIQNEKDPFALLNLSLHPEGVFVLIPPKLQLETPIQVLHLVTEPGISAMPRVHLSVGAHARVQWISRTIGKPACINSLFDISLDEGAQVHHTAVFEHGDHGWHLDAVRATLKRSSLFQSISVTQGSQAVRQDYHVTLAGENCEASLEGAWMLHGNRQAHAHVMMDHQAPHCRSMQRFKAILADSSQSSFEGKIYVHPEAQKTEAYQLNNNLVLGERALAQSKPSLEIFADDVKASHGATVAQVNDQQLFYLKTRGLSSELSKQLLVLGFYGEILDKIPHESVRSAMKKAYEHLT